MSGLWSVGQLPRKVQNEVRGEIEVELFRKKHVKSMVTRDTGKDTDKKDSVKPLFLQIKSGTQGETTRSVKKGSGVGGRGDRWGGGGGGGKGDAG